MSTAPKWPPPVAPWAEIVPGVGPMTVADLLGYPDDGSYRYELVEGVLVRMVGSRSTAIRVTMNLLPRFALYVEEHGLGQVTPPDAVYDFENTGQKDTGLLPDIAFYNASREALVGPNMAYPFAPDLAVEIASPRQYRPAMKSKAERYLRGGTALVWIVWPQRRQVDVWHRGDIVPLTLGEDETLDAEDVVPGFTYPVANLFRGI